MGERIKVGPDGFVELDEYMGSDEGICRAARVSYDQTKKVSDDQTLIRYLMRHNHTTPFEMAELKFIVRVPMDIWRQWVRHRMASINEYSTRYREAINEQSIPDYDEWRTQSKTNKQGSGEALPANIGAECTDAFIDAADGCLAAYKSALSRGVAYEQTWSHRRTDLRPPAPLGRARRGLPPSNPPSAGPAARAAAGPAAPPPLVAGPAGVAAPLALPAAPVEDPAGRAGPPWLPRGSPPSG